MRITRFTNTGFIFFQPAGRLRSGWRIALYILLTALAVQLAVWVYYAAGGLRVTAVLTATEQGNLILLYSLLCAAALSTAFLVIRYVDRRSFGALGFSLHGRWLTETGQGVLLGFLMVAAVFAVQWASGAGRFDRGGTALGAAASVGTMYLLMFTLAAALEEILVRGYVFQALIEGTGRIAAVAITSGLFGLGHIMNPHATALGLVNTVLAGAWLAVGYLKTRSLWLPTAMHLSWNLCLGYVFGFPVSGLRVSSPLLRAEPAGPEWVTGGAYGPEGGVLCTAVMLLCAVAILRSSLFRPAPDADSLWAPIARYPAETPQV